MAIKKLYNKNKVNYSKNDLTIYTLKYIITLNYNTVIMSLRRNRELENVEYRGNKLQEGYKKLKNRIYRNALIKSLIIGGSIGLIVASVFLIIIKLTEWKNIYYFLYPISVLVCGVGVGVTSYFALFPKEKKLARRLDNELQLKQNVQTMVAFDGREGDIIELQRKTTDEKLQRVELKSVSFKKFWVYIIVGVLAIASIVTALIIPSRKKEVEPPSVNNIPAYNDSWEFSNWAKIRLENLIESVNESSVDADAKVLLVEELEGLLRNVASLKKKSEMIVAVVASMRNVDAIVDDYNTYFVIGQELRITQSNEAKLLAEAIEAVNEETAIFGEVEFTEDLTEVSSALISANESLDELKTLLADFCGKTQIALDVTATKLPYTDTDALYNGIEDLAVSLKTLADDQTQTLTYGGAREQIVSTFEASRATLSDALIQQNKNWEIKSYIIAELQVIFEIPDGEMPDLSNVPYASSTEDGGDDDDDKVSGGGYDGSDPETVYRGNELIYDPEEQKHVVYGELYDRYNTTINEMIMRGEVPEDLKAIIEEYFKYLDYSEQTESSDPTIE